MLTRRDVIVSVLTAGFCAVVVAAQSKKQVMGSAVFDWNAVEAKSTKAGQRRDFFQSPTATLDELQCHVTTVDPGIASHAPHQHPDEELIIIKEGTLEALVNGRLTTVGAGSIIFAASNELHGVRNVGTTPATYFVLRWKSPGMPKAQPGEARK
jgi:quercetin dioxygenase-like cupin family protein